MGRGALVKTLENHDVDLVLLVGYMRIASDAFVGRQGYRINVGSATQSTTAATSRVKGRAQTLHWSNKEHQCLA